MSQPLAEVFGYRIDDLTDRAKRYRQRKLCPFNNKVPNCTKDKADNPLGVCCIYHGNSIAITCPIRFREDWLVVDDAATFFFGEDAKWSSLTEVRLTDANGTSAGNINLVLVAYDSKGKITDFGALEIQGVYISGNVRNPFEQYISDPERNSKMDWSAKPSYPRPDYLSSSRKRLVPQLLYKGGILHSWGKKIAVALTQDFYKTLPELEEIEPSQAEIAWLLYELIPITENGQVCYKLTRVNTIYTKFTSSLLTITTPKPGEVSDFMSYLQGKLDKQISNPPNNKLIESPV